MTDSLSIPCVDKLGMLAGWLFWVYMLRPFETVFQSISDRLLEREKEKRIHVDRREKKCPNNPHLHPLQAQIIKTIALLLSKFV